MKVYVAAPGQHQWPTLPDHLQERLLTILTEQFNEEKLEVSLKRPRKRSTQPHPIKQHLAIGLQCALRCLKHNQCSLLLVCSSLTPIILSKPLLLLSQLHSVPSIRMKHLSSFLVRLFAIPHCAVLAFKSSSETHSQLKTLVDSLKEVIGGGERPSSSPAFVPGQVLAPYQNPQRLSAGVTKKKKKKKKIVAKK